MSIKSISIVGLVIVAAFGAGWMVGASGRASIERARDSADLRAGAARAEALLLQAQVSLSDQNYGDARRALDQARAATTAVQRRFRETGRVEAAGQLAVSLAHVADAAQLAANADPSATAAAAAATSALRAAVAELDGTEPPTP